MSASASGLYDISATDPRTFVIAALVLAVVAFLAAYAPARRAGNTDAIAVLRE